MANTCGTCSMCCKLLRIDEINKPQGKWCPSCKVGVGCRVYDTRPAPCRAFECMYIQPLYSDLPLEMRPDKLKVMFFSYTVGTEFRESIPGVTDGPKVIVVVDPMNPDAYRKPLAWGYIRGFIRECGEVLLCIEERMYHLTEKDLEGAPPVLSRCGTV